MIDTVFFDWGGVIASDPGDDFLTQLLMKYGASEAQAAEVYDTHLRTFMRGEITEAEFWQDLRVSYGLSVPHSIASEFTQWQGLIVDSSVMDLVQRIKAAGYKTAILSNVIEPTYNALEQTGNYRHFDAVIASCKVGLAKPQLEIYELALQTMDTSAQQSLFIDDKAKNLVPATGLGFTTVLAQYPQQIVEDVQRALQM